jgi:uncharacterized membrane protein YhiD involved in acid resistance
MIVAILEALEALQFAPNNNLTEVLTGWGAQGDLLWRGLQSLALAAALGAVLALRIRRPGTPPRRPVVIHTQILLAVVGAMVMIVTGESVARAFGIVGAAGLIRYRARIDNTKDAGVMLATFGVGLTAGVGLYLFAIFATAAIFLLLLIVESVETKADRIFALKVPRGNDAELQRKIEALLASQHCRYVFRGYSEGVLHYDVKITATHSLELLLNEIIAASGNEKFKFQETNKEADN